MNSSVFLVTMIALILLIVCVLLVSVSLMKSQRTMLLSLLESERQRSLDLTNRVQSKNLETYLSLVSASPGQHQSFEQSQVNLEEYFGSSDEEELKRMGLETDAEVLLDQESEFKALGLTE